MTRFCMRAALACAAVVAAACGGGGSGPPTGPTPPVDTTQTQNFSGTVGAYGLTSHVLTAATRAGTLTATLTWTLGADLDLYVTATTCTGGGYPPDTCVLLARATSSSTTTLREEVTLTVAAGTALVVWVDNFHPQTAVPYSLAVVVR